MDNYVTLPIEYLLVVALVVIVWSLFTSEEHKNES
jgi:hypothetical protein